MFLGIVGAISIGLSLGLLGSGGSILTVPVLMFCVGQEEKVAIAGSLAIVGSVSLVGAIPHAVRRRIDYRSLVLFGLPGMGGAYFGAFLSAFVTGAIQLIVFSLLMLVAGVLMLRPLEMNRRADQGPRSTMKVVVEGLVVGIVTGFVGVGGGFLIIPALVLLGGLPMHRAIGTSLIIIAFKSLAGFVKSIDVLDDLGLRLDWNILAVFSLFGIIGSFVGNAIGGRLPQSTLRRVFAGFLFVVALFMLARTWPWIGDAKTTVATGAR